MKLQGAIAAVLLLANCSTGPAATPARPPTTSAAAVVPISSQPTGAQLAAQGCGQTPIYSGGQLPEWATVNAPSLPYVVAKPGTILGYLFTRPLRAGNPENPSNKILWYVATPRRGQALQAEGHPLGADQPIARFTQPANSFPGEIYPSGPTVPTPGCWRFTLIWLGGAQQAEVDLNFT